MSRYKPPRSERPLPETWLSLPQVAARLGTSRPRIARAVKRGAIPAMRIKGCHTRVAESVVDDLVKRATTDSPLSFLGI